MVCLVVSQLVVTNAAYADVAATEESRAELERKVMEHLASVTTLSGAELSTLRFEVGQQLATD